MNLLLKMTRQSKTLNKKIRAELITEGLSNLSPIQAYILYELQKQDGQRPSDLAEKVGRLATAFTSILDSLEIQNIIERRSNGSDRRSIFIYLTEQGKHVTDSVVIALDRIEGETK